MQEYRRDFVLSLKPERIYDFGCHFTVYRRRKRRKVISVALWKGSLGYVPSLSFGVMWWGRNVGKLFPGYNLRIFIDSGIYNSPKLDPDFVQELQDWIYSIEDAEYLDNKLELTKEFFHDYGLDDIDRFYPYFRKGLRDKTMYEEYVLEQIAHNPRKVMKIIINSQRDRLLKQDVDWRMIFNQLAKRPNIELWFYDCGWGRTKKKYSMSNHENTFGSLVRYQPLFDPSVEITVVRNIELLSSVRDRDVVFEWEESGKKANIMAMFSYLCSSGLAKENYFKTCSRVNLIDKSMIISTFAFRGTLSREYFEEMQYYALKVSPGFLYGIDETVLTKLMIYGGEHTPPILNEDNTSITFLTIFDVIIKFMLLTGLIKLFIPRFSFYKERCPHSTEYLNWIKDRFDYGNKYGVKALDKQIEKDDDMLYFQHLSICWKLYEDILSFFKREYRKIKNRTRTMFKIYQIKKAFASMVFKSEQKILDIVDKIKEGDIELFIILARFTVLFEDMQGFPLKTKSFNDSIRNSEERPGFDYHFRKMLTY